VENENYAEAVVDLTLCLEKRKDRLPYKMRRFHHHVQKEKAMTRTTRLTLSSLKAD